MTIATVAFDDRAAIHDLFTRYCCALDNGEVETVVACFVEDAVLKSPMIDIRGHDAIRAFAGRFAAQRATGTQFRHMVSNIAVAIDGDHATATAYLLVLISEGGAHRTLPPGRYECELLKRDGAWRFARRTVFHDHAYALDAIATPVRQGIRRRYPPTRSLKPGAAAPCRSATGSFPS